MVSPDQVTSVALGWVTALGTIVGAVLTGLLLLWPKITELRGKIDSISKRQDAQSARMTQQDATITSVALNSPAVAVIPPTKE